MTLLDVDIAFSYPHSGRWSEPWHAIVCRWQDPIEDPQVTVLLGASGSGKTTLLRCLGGLERPNRGHVRFGDRIWFDADRGIHLPPDRRGIGCCFRTTRCSRI